MYGGSFSSIFALAWLCTGLSIGSPVIKRQNPAVSQDMFDQFTRYAALSAATYASTCPSPPFGVTITKQINNKATNTQGFIARDDAAREVILAFRGTSNIQDFMIDLSEDLVPFNTTGVTNCEGCMAHEGFLKAWNSVAQESIDGVKAELAANSGYKVTVTGHSLGGSLASLATVSMLGSGIDVTTFTYGQPRTGNQAFADFVDQQAPQGKMFRVTHANDGVPQVVSTSNGYSHHSTEFWQKDAATAAGTFQCSGQEPQVSRATRFCLNNMSNQRWWQDCNNSVRGTGLGAGGIGINAAHLKYFGISIGNPLDRGAEACNGKKPGLLGTIGGLLGVGKNN
ncbi:hypothetical protein DL766_003791 [Monosporascus sp. MC13-8B]|uniref:Fungal lipase-type domain-containing protein n=1 Tax=Monosporascus cannonballus TaxID=155416 RepID=A0ABY0HGZ7_9PEZI|nr:hypothetical protein DL763_010809 [Monosporascus cannonballus]RYO90268.1 hypothetical protein DL762_002790 [Monosporascus cannonballus]RYP32818.1 hypothetical protein DL766_003791 [Monosporascus sp. MC13-8B]